MRSIILIHIMLLSLLAGNPDKKIERGYERGIDRYDRDACNRARELAKANYDIVELDAGCRCEKGDDRQWQCDIGFTYRGKEL